MADATSKPEHYSDAGFWTKLAKNALAAGRAVVLRALCLYYALLDPATPKWAKTVIVGALGYFIFPIDLIPDAIPVIGYSDDLGVLLTATAFVAAHVTPEHGRKAEQTLQQWFGKTAEVAAAPQLPAGKS